MLTCFLTVFGLLWCWPKMYIDPEATAVEKKTCQNDDRTILGNSIQINNSWRLKGYSIKSFPFSYTHTQYFLSNNKLHNRTNSNMVFTSSTRKNATRPKRTPKQPPNTQTNSQSSSVKLSFQEENLRKKNPPCSLG